MGNILSSDCNLLSILEWAELRITRRVLSFHPNVNGLTASSLSWFRHQVNLDVSVIGPKPFKSLLPSTWIHVSDVSDWNVCRDAETVPANIPPAYMPVHPTPSAVCPLLVTQASLWGSWRYLADSTLPCISLFNCLIGLLFLSGVQWRIAAEMCVLVCMCACVHLHMSCLGTPLTRGLPACCRNPWASVHLHIKLWPSQSAITGHRASIPKFSFGTGGSSSLLWGLYSSAHSHVCPSAYQGLLALKYSRWIYNQWLLFV